jgi:formate hydrogenlyase subunit 3/multisubunit Na+/H+ antiporter MnhD subunit
MAASAEGRIYGWSVVDLLMHEIRDGVTLPSSILAVVYWGVGLLVLLGGVAALSFRRRLFARILRRQRELFGQRAQGYVQGQRLWGITVAAVLTILLGVIIFVSGFSHWWQDLAHIIWAQQEVNLREAVLKHGK